MAIYTPVSISGYNSNPPDDDGSEVSSNEIEWAKHKSKLGDPVKTLSEGIDTNLVIAFNKVFANATTALAVTTTLTAVHHGDILRTTGSGITLNLTAAATLGDGWNALLIVTDANSVIVDPNGAELINGSATFTANQQNVAYLITCNGTDFIITDWANAYLVNNQTAKTTIIDADELGISDSAASDVNKKITFANFKTQLKTDLVASTTVKGLVELLTSAELKTGTDTTRAATAAAIAALGTKATAGKIDHPSGITIQWDKYTGGESTPAITFATAFSGTPFIALGNSSSSSPTGIIITVLGLTSTTLTLNQRQHDGSQETEDIFWLVIGPT